VRPLIGIPCLWDEPRSDQHVPRFGHNQAYVYAVARAGGLPILLPLLTEFSLLRETYDRLDGILLGGGDDVHPVHFGEEPHPKTVLVPPASDEVELTLTRWALDEGKPVLGICRGHQVLNVAAGGTLYQDLPSQYPTPLGIDHTRKPDRPRDLPVHTITPAPGTRLAVILGPGPLPVNSSHHQAVRDLAPTFVASAWAPDGVLEGLEQPGSAFCVGVQFHPEEMWEREPRVRGLFRALVEAARSAGPRP
jgi:putative glutamine amidotransferase